MANDGNELADLMNELSKEADQEIEARRDEKMSPDEKVLQKLAYEILHLERGMTQPGHAVADNTRLIRLMEFIDKADF